MDRDGLDDLLVAVGERPRARFHPGDSPVYFGRAANAAVKLCRTEDTAVARRAGAFLWYGGLWYVRNESESRPFYVVVPSGRFPLHAVRADGTKATWAVSAPGLRLSFTTPIDDIDVSVQTVRPAPGPTPDPDDDPDGPSTPRERLRDRDRRLVAAKFLAHGVDGPVLGDKEAAQVGNEHLPAGENEMTPAAVMTAVVRAREVLVDHGVTGIAGAQNIRNLRRELIAWGYLTEQDGRWLRRARP